MSTMKKARLDFSRYTNLNYKLCSRPITPREATKWNNGERPLPITLLEEAIQEDTKINHNEKHLVHWFRSDLRVQDNTALTHLVEESKRLGAHPCGLYIISTAFWQAHLEGPFKVDFILQSLDRLKKSLACYNIPLSIVCTDELVNPQWFKQLLSERFDSSTVFFNIQYEYDELMRDLAIMKTEGLHCKVYHDQCVVVPGTLKTGKGTQYTKFTPWYKKWKEVNFDVVGVDHEFPKGTMPSLVSDEIKLPSEFHLDSARTYREADEALKAWIPKAKKYNDDKDTPALDSTSHLSAYITVGELSPRQVIRQCKVEPFVREVAFRDFYRHIVVNWPYLMMYIPFNTSALDLKWNEDISRFEKWCLGQTGFPFVDAAMRQLLKTGFMNNRCRMVTASFLSKDLGQDWRMGEKWFHHHLIDADLASNNGGWGWCSSTGIDAQPWFRIFNAYTQSAKCDPDGKFIKKWVPELKDVDAADLHGPITDVDGYPEPIVDRSVAREEALERYREAF